MTMVSMRLMSGPQIQSPSAGPANTTMSRTCSHIPAAACSPPSSATAEPAQRQRAALEMRGLSSSRGGRSSLRRAAGGGAGRRWRRRWREVGARAGAGAGVGMEWAAERRRRCAAMAAAAAEA